MAVTLAQAAQRIEQDLIAGVATGIVTVDTFIGALPTEITDNVKIDWNHEATRGAVTRLSTGSGGAITESAATANLSGAYLERFVGDVDIPNDLAANDEPYQINQKSIALGEELGSQLIVGTGVHATGDLIGLETYAVGGQVDAVNGALTLKVLDDLALKVKAGAGNMALVMNANLLTNFRALMRAAGGATVMDYAGVSVDAFGGIPVLRSDFIPNTELTNTASSVYAVSLDDAFTKVYMKRQENGEMVSVGEAFQKSGNDVKTRRLGFNAGLVIRSPLAVARASGLTI